jgi:FKBP-type peptidyl-prolyl cis-trans isomerase
MKKITLLAAVAIVAAGLASCGKSTPKADLKNDVDSLSYAIGVAQSNGIKEYLAGNLGVDTAYIDEFIKGLNEGANAGDDKRKAAYYAGIQIGQQISNQMVRGINSELFGNDSTQSISLKNFMAGFISGTTGKKGLMNMQQAQEVAQRKMQEIKEGAMEKQYGAYKKQNEAFVAKYAKSADVKKLAKGVCYKVLKAGTGAVPTETSKVKLNYEGKTIDGKVFDSSYERKEPATFMVNQVIPGFTEALKHMPVGSTWEVVIPQDQAYGARETGGQIKPFSTLIFKIELLGIEEAEQPKANAQNITPEQQAQLEAAMKAAQAQGKK